ncbi:hypothetical protein K502DRAFT_324415 [Neoconidiobolus thromboides FSU 785]|nr:hypothetical protein K502DRAFT_324415 [Neoconidiobolus thromboides FSU 785]
MEPEYTNIAQLLNNIIEDDEKLKLIFSDQIQLFEYSNNSVNDNNIDESSLFQKKQALQTKVKELDLELNNLRKLGTNTADDNILTTPLKQNSWLAEMNYDQFKDKIGRFIQFFEKCFLPHLDKVKVTKEEEDVDGRINSLFI